MTHNIVVRLEDEADVQLLAQAAEARSTTLTRAALTLADDLAGMSASDMRTPAVQLAKLMIEAARMTRLGAAIRTAPIYVDQVADAFAAVDAVPDQVLADTLAAAAGVDDATDVDATSPDTDGLEAPPETPSDEGQKADTPTPAKRTRTRKAPTVTAPPPADKAEHTDPPEDAGMRTAQAIAAARRSGALSVLPPLPDDDAVLEGETVGGKVEL